MSSRLSLEETEDACAPSAKYFCNYEYSSSGPSEQPNFEGLALHVGLSNVKTNPPHKTCLLYSLPFFFCTVGPFCKRYTHRCLDVGGSARTEEVSFSWRATAWGGRAVLRRLGLKLKNQIVLTETFKN